MKVAGQEIEVETFVDEEDEDTIKHSTKELAANRESFIVMRDNMKKKGLKVRASFDGSEEVSQWRGRQDPGGRGGRGPCAIRAPPCSGRGRSGVSRRPFALPLLRAAAALVTTSAATHQHPANKQQATRTPTAHVAIHSP